MKGIDYHSVDPGDSEELERFAIGPIPAVSFQVDRYMSIMEAVELIDEGGLGPGQEIRPHPEDKSIMVLGTWCFDTFMPVLILNEDQLLHIELSEWEDWDSKDYVCVPYDTQYMVARGFTAKEIDTLKQNGSGDIISAVQE